MNVYDFDKTLYKRDSTVEFIKYCYIKQPSLIVCAPKQILGALLYALRIIDVTTFKKYIYTVFAKTKNIDKKLNDFWDININRINNFYVHKDDDLIISASPEFIVGEACKRLKIERYICSEVDKLTGEVLGKNNSKENKVIKMKQLGYHLEDIDEFYSDSYKDQPLARLAKKPYMIKKGQKVDWIFKNDNR